MKEKQIILKTTAIYALDALFEKAANEDLRRQISTLKSKIIAEEQSEFSAVVQQVVDLKQKVKKSKLS